MTHWERAQQAIGQGYLTNSKSPKAHVFGVYPTHVTRGYGCDLYAPGPDGQERRYVDFICGLGTNLLGYSNPEVRQAIHEALDYGWSHSLPTTLEVETAETLKELMPVEAVKFLKTGTEACMAAVRIARAATGRKKILSEGYHGWSDLFVSLTPPAEGVPEDPNMQLFTSLEQVDSETAAVIVEPVIVDWSPARIKWLKELRETCDRCGALLIFDEIITGFRFKQFSVASASEVLPDLLCLGKGMGNGMSISAVGGSAKLMHGSYFVSSTYAGECLSLSAAKKVMSLLKRRHPWDIDVLWEKGARWTLLFNEIAPELVKLRGYPTRGVFEGDSETLALFFQECCKSGVLFGKSWWMNWHLAECGDWIIGMCSDVLTRIKRGNVRLEGELPTSPFAMKVRKL